MISTASGTLSSTEFQQEVDGRRAQDEKAPGPIPGAPASADDPAQRLEQGWKPVNLVEDEELVGLRSQEEHRVSSFVPIRRGLKVRV